MIEFLDAVSQYAIPLFTLSGIFFLARKVKWGFVLAFLAQPFWMLTAYVHGQWGVFFNTVIYTGIIVYGIYNWFSSARRDVSLGIDKAGETR